MKRSIRGALLGLCLVGATGCFAARNIRPVGDDQWAAGVSMGGPMFTNLGGAIPTPLMTASARYGLTDTTDLDFNSSARAGAGLRSWPADGCSPTATFTA